MRSAAGIDLYWLPLGAGGHSVRLNGKVFEVVAAMLDDRDRLDLYHSALQVYIPEGRFVIEQAPAWIAAAERGVVAEGAVGARAAGRLRLFRYEVRRWRDGTISDLAAAVESPRLLSEDVNCARRLLELVPQVPTPVWAAMSSVRARCGTQTRPFHGFSRAAGSTSSRSRFRAVAGLRVGAPAS